MVQSSQTAVHQHFPGITWNGARDECKPFGLENRHDYLQEISDEQEFWIGKAIYKEPTPWIEIIGCYQIWSSHDHPFYSVTSIGTCKQKCDSKNMGRYFGYRKSHHDNCVCQPTYISRIYRRHIETCVSAENFFLYEVYNGTVYMSSDPGDCTTVCCGLCNMHTQSLNHLEGRRCSSVDNRIVGRCDVNKDPVRCFSGVFFNVNGRRMLNVTDHFCSENKTLFICKTNNAVTEPNTQRPLFTTVINKDKQTNTSSGHMLTPAKDKNNHRTTGINITETKTQNPLFTVETSKGTLINTLSGHAFLSSKDSTSPCTTESTLYTMFTSAAPNTISKTGFTNDQRDNGDKSTSVGVVIGGILGACCILFITAVLVVCKIRSKGIFKQTTKCVKEDTTQTNFSNTIYQDPNEKTDRTSAMSLSNQTYGLNGANTPVYAVVNKLQKLENTDVTYTDEGCGEYDHLHDIQNRKMCQQENLYDSHGAPRNEEDQTYDSSYFGKRISNDGNEVYDHSFSVVGREYFSNENHDSHNRNNVNANIYDKAS
ncbi:Hypothetical predicted protein [Mytilus galloprovincialis]|uniref:C-type lectin domain-containing protein n=1 Tax=Mytilus galloprovincialis TaxID=29158 RepID=A0A8B6GU20_MYTGA|nr:Hypothetical predicted protein [Mytilus galloprovincialis]